LLFRLCRDGGPTRAVPVLDLYVLPNRGTTMLGYILRRILAVIPVMLLVAVFVFLLLRLTPGDPAAIIAGDMATPAQLERIREAMGLNQPLHVQFFTWVGRLLQGDLGTSLISSTPVAGMIADRMGPTLAIALLTIL